MSKQTNLQRVAKRLDASQNPLARSVEEQSNMQPKASEVTLSADSEDLSVVLRDGQGERLCYISLDSDGRMRFSFRDAIAIRPVGANSFTVEGF